ncbi:unnamed protein product [Rhizoctonia solani]|uniref:Peptidase C14 caspase domain-containing protein n=1 Tax=Rhizoctonia solani TaxID=456999 RepID=A0A8H3GFK1_9AGAM|nr:unnamed protein product [Rhizoctonia solani]
MRETQSFPIHALVIGIDDYDYHDPLVGAVRDADAFEEFLKTNLHVPKENIVNIREKEATRVNIISGFRKLQDDHRIQWGHPIVIFYAGHGGTLPAPTGWESGGRKIQSLIPVDCHRASTKVKQPITPIPDRTIAALLSDLCDAKGNNITVILDCCHSASGTRTEIETHSRFIPTRFLPNISADTDSKIWGRGSRSIVDADAGLGETRAETHVLLAACGELEEAQEDQVESRGYFSMNLLKILQKENLSNLTYSRCMRLMPALPSPRPQHPVCEGKYSGRILFNATGTGANFEFIPVELEPEDNDDSWNQGVHRRPSSQVYVLSAGTSTGISVNNLFELHANDISGPNNPPLGELIVYNVEMRRAFLRPVQKAPISCPPKAYARQTGYGPDQSLKVHFTPGFLNTAKQDRKWHSSYEDFHRRRVFVESSAREAELIVDVKGTSEATFISTHSLLKKYGIENLPPKGSFPVPADSSALRVIAAASRWSWHLNRTPVRSTVKDDIHIEFSRLEAGARDPASGNKNILQPIKNLNVNGVADFVVSKQDHYGLTLVNNSERNLHAYCVYFGATDLTIRKCYLNSTASIWKNPKEDAAPEIGKTWKDFSLPRNSRVPIGHGSSSGVRPLRFQLDPDQDIEVGVMKLFVTSGHVDFGPLEQQSPFTVHGRRIMDDEEMDAQEELDEIWDVTTLTLIQRRFAHVAESGESVKPQPGISHRVPAAEVTCEKPVRVLGDNSGSKEVVWFGTDPMSALQLKTFSHLQLRTYSKDQGKASNSNGNWTWFEVRVVDRNSHQRTDDNGDPLRWTSHYNQRCSAGYVWMEGEEFGPHHPLWANMTDGDRIEVAAVAQLSGWVNEGQKAVLRIW